MVMTVTAAGMAWQELRQCIGAQQFEINANSSLLGLKYAHTGTIKFMQRSAADTANNDCINLMPV